MIQQLRNPIPSTGSQTSSKEGDIRCHFTCCIYVCIVPVLFSARITVLYLTPIIFQTYIIPSLTMNWLTSTLVSQLVLMLDWAIVEANDKLGAAECLERGFNSAKLLCSSCDDLRQFDLSKVAADCVQCCTDDGGSASLENTKYEKAILEVCG